MDQCQAKYADKTNEELLDEYARTKDMDLKREIVMRYLYVVTAIALQMRSVYAGVTQVEDVIQEGIIVMMNIIDRYDRTRNVKFETYLSRRMRGLVLDIVRKQEWGSRVVKRDMKEIDNAAYELMTKTGKMPDPKTVAEYLGMSYERYQRILEKNSLSNIVSLDMMLEDAQARYAPQVPAAGTEQQPEETYLKKELLDLLEKGISRLKEKERIIISLYYVEGLRMNQIAKVLEISAPRVTQIHAGAIKKLKEYLEKELV